LNIDISAIFGYNTEMKTSVELDSKKVALARALSPTSTLRELIDQALQAFINEGRRSSIADLLGTPFFSGNLSKMRKRTGRTTGANSGR